MNKLRVASAVVVATLIAGCQTTPTTTNSAPAPAPTTAAQPAAPAPTSTVSKNAVLQAFDFAKDPDALEGWALGWNKNDKVVIDDMDVEAGVGMKLSFKANASGWGDANIKLTKLSAPYPGAVAVRLLVPASAGRIKGLSMGCALNSPWSEAASWATFKGDESITVKGAEYKTQELICALGASDPKQTDLILRLGGERVRYSGNLYIQSVKLLKSN